MNSNRSSNISGRRCRVSEVVTFVVHVFIYSSRNSNIFKRRSIGAEEVIFVVEIVVVAVTVGVATPLQPL